MVKSLFTLNTKSPSFPELHKMLNSYQVTLMTCRHSVKHGRSIQAGKTETNAEAPKNLHSVKAHYKKTLGPKFKALLIHDC